MGWLRHLFADPDVSRHLLREEDEVIVDLIRRHWVAYVVPGLIGLLGLSILVLALLASAQVAGVLMVIALGVLLWACYRVLHEARDSFVITNMRVFRLHGVFTRSLATMPLGRILDITVVKPFVGRILGYGHFTFESAAQEQGLRDIRFVGDPDRRDLTIQRVVQRSGLRGPRPGSGLRLPGQ